MRVPYPYICMLVRSYSITSGRITSQIVILSLFYINPAVFCITSQIVILSLFYINPAVFCMSMTITFSRGRGKRGDVAGAVLSRRGRFTPQSRLAPSHQRCA